MLPAIVFGHLFFFVASYFETGSLLSIIFGDLIWVILYFSGVYAMYRHVRWREKYIPDLLKPKQNEIFDEVQGE